MKHNETRFASLESDIKKTDKFKQKLTLIATYAKNVTGAERCSLFTFDKKKDKLQSIYNDGVKGQLVLGSNIGIVGYSFHKRTSILENNPQQNPIFFSKVDQRLDYYTKNILAVPIIDSYNKRIGVIQLLNKEEEFNKQDQVSIEKLSTFLFTVLEPSSHHTSPKKKMPTKEMLDTENLQNMFDHYLANKKLFLKEDGNAYYKILDMKRDYFISASACYILNDTDQEIKIYYYSVSDEFLSVDMYVKISEDAKGLQVSENISLPDFTCYPIEEDI